ncbi:hypothetical protein DOM22_13285 [Bdellovibrio sp. ZAP7]|uniref:hypothetical protein n=1 Tax=Bdellovibrio sp. ZAP7 TaxID=2231053 RepID=UPI0011649272|nr:hypothetical protein [Bdellovibrio sp. ZAP7]QDK46060.1 hypothetical protein DOM22_13285 [Bdellovibrio sp. ZAP7]
MRAFFSILILLNSFNSYAAPAKQQIVFYTPLQSSVVSSGDYEDIRIDADQDQSIDLWVLKKGNTQITVRLTGKSVNSFTIKKFSNSNVIEAEYQVKNDRFSLVAKSVRNPRVMNGSAEESSCDDSLSDLSKKISDLSLVSKAKLGDAAAKVIKCDAAQPEVSKKIQSALSSLIVDKELQACISGDKVQAIFPKKQKADILYYGKKLELDLKKIGANQEPQTDLITCDSQESIEILNAKYMENGNIAFSIPKDYDPSKLSKESKPLLLHELLHRVGIVKDTDVEKIVNVCVFNMAVTTTPSVGGGGFGDEQLKISHSANDNGKKNNVVKGDVENAKEVKPPVRAPSSTAADKGGGGEGVNIAKEVSVAEVKQAVPSADKLAVNSVNMTDEGKAQAVAASQRQSAPVFAMADRAMGVMNTPALASSDDSYSYSSSTASSDSSSSSSSRSSSSRSGSGQRYQARYEGYESKAVADSNKNYDAQKGIYVPSSKNGMKVVEEVDLTRQTNAADRTGSAQTATNSRNVASTGRGTVAPRGSQAAGEEQPDSNEVNVASAGGGSSVGSGSGGGSGTFYSGGGSDRKTNANTRRGVASGSTGTASADSREEVLSRITGTSYKEVKSKLSTSEFKNSLVQNQIKIVDTYGNEVGASQARTIFLDDGSRFIMQRRK